MSTKFLTHFPTAEEFLKNASDVSRLPDYSQAKVILSDAARGDTELSSEAFEALISLVLDKSMLIDTLDALPNVSAPTADIGKGLLRDIAGAAQFEGRFQPEIGSWGLARLVRFVLKTQDEIDTFVAQARKRIAHHDQLEAGKD